MYCRIRHSVPPLSLHSSTCSNRYHCFTSEYHYLHLLLLAEVCFSQILNLYLGMSFLSDECCFYSWIRQYFHSCFQQVIDQTSSSSHSLKRLPVSSWPFPILQNQCLHQVLPSWENSQSIVSSYNLLQCRAYNFPQVYSQTSLKMCHLWLWSVVVTDTERECFTPLHL
jgi:hypothetical protein